MMGDVSNLRRNIIMRKIATSILVVAIMLVVSAASVSAEKYEVEKGDSLWNSFAMFQRLSPFSTSYFSAETLAADTTSMIATTKIDVAIFLIIMFLLRLLTSPIIPYGSWVMQLLDR